MVKEIEGLERMSLVFEEMSAISMRIEDDVKSLFCKTSLQGRLRCGLSKRGCVPGRNSSNCGTKDFYIVTTGLRQCIVLSIPLCEYG